MTSTNVLGENEHSWACLETHPLQELQESDNYMQSGRSMTSQPLVERSRQVMTFLAAPDQKVALLVIPGWPDAVPALPCSWCSGAPRSLSKVCWCNLSDLLSLSIMGNCFLFLINPFLCITHLLYIVRLKVNEKVAFFSFLLR